MKRGSGRHTVCDEGCHCVDLNPRRNFLVGLTGQSCYDFAERSIERNLVDVKLQQLTYQHADRVSRDILPLVHTPESEDDKYRDTGFIHVAWNCTLACGNTRDLTAACQRGLDHYYGNSAGSIGNLGQQHIVLEQSYECIDVYSKQAHIFGLTWDLIHTITSCNHANIKQNTISKVEVHTPNPEHPGTVLPNSVHSHTKTKAINPLNIRTVNTPVTHAHDYALVCYNDKEITRACQDHKYAYYCTSSGSIAHKGEADSFCDEYYECRDLYPDKTLSTGPLGRCTVRTSNAGRERSCR